MQTKSKLLLLLTLLCLVLCACSASPNYTSAASESPVAMPAPTMSPASGGMQNSFVSKEMSMDMEEAIMDESPMGDHSINSSTGGSDTGAAARSAKRMIITTVNLNLQTKEFDAGVVEVENIVTSLGGFIQDSHVEGENLYGRSGGRSANFTVRVPSQRLGEFFTGVGNIFNITSKSQSSQDITDSYYDTESRLNSLKIQEARLLEMLASSTELQYLIEVQRELANVQYQIDSFTSSKMRMENQVEMSTVHIYLSEVVEYTPVEPAPITFGERLLRTISDSFLSFVTFTQNTILALIWMFPFLLIMTVILVIIIVSAKKKKARKKAALPPVDETPAE